MKRTDPRSVLFDLGDFIIEPELAELLSYAEIRRLVLRHGRGDWGLVSPLREKENDEFTHPRNRAPGSRAESVHSIGNVKVAIVTKQERGRRTTHLILL